MLDSSWRPWKHLMIQWMLNQSCQTWTTDPWNRIRKHRCCWVIRKAALWAVVSRVMSASQKTGDIASRTPYVFPCWQHIGGLYLALVGSALCQMWCTGREKKNSPCAEHWLVIHCDLGTSVSHWYGICVHVFGLMVCLGAPHCLTMWPHTAPWALR